MRRKTNRLKEDITGHMCPGHPTRTVSRHTNPRYKMQFVENHEGFDMVEIEKVASDELQPVDRQHCRLSIWMVKTNTEQVITK